MKIRAYRPADLAAVVELFGASIHVLAARDYDAAQRAAWAPAEPDLGEWSGRLIGQMTLVAEVGVELSGFIACSDDGHIDLLYTSPSHARRGVASALYQDAERQLREAGATELVTEASLVAAPFFARQGFRVEEEQKVVRRGIEFRRYRMKKTVTSA
jgi:putative acetyltransferase